MLNNSKIILSGGGTGGHIFPAVAIANVLKQEIKNVDILFVGASGKMEMEKVPLAGFNIKSIPIAGIKRKEIVSNLLLPFKVVLSLFKSYKIIKQFNPDLVIGTGGYVTGPVLCIAQLLNIPTLIQEQNALPGLTNKILGKCATKICVAYPNMNLFFKKEKLIISGNPIRSEVLNIENKMQEAELFFNLKNNAKTILIVGGSLGAKGINEAITHNLQLFENNEAQLIWQTGSAFYETAKEKISKFKNNHIRVYPFISRMDLAYCISTIVISRAGASAIAELSMLKKPSILVPLPTAAEDHQTKNALRLKEKQATILIKEKHAKQDLLTAAFSLINDDLLQKSLSENLEQFAQPDATQVILNEIKQILKV